MNKAFTLIELLVVVAIMGLMGTASVGGYRQMQRGMARRGVIDNVNQFIRAAYARAQIDRQYTAVYFWNETIRGETDDVDSDVLVAGRAVAVRQYGRISKIDGDILVDEFGDLQMSYATNSLASGSQAPTMKLYKLSNGQDTQIKYALVGANLKSTEVQVPCLQGRPLNDNFDNVGKGRVTFWGFEKRSGGTYNDWKVGDAYGFEFATIELPHGYVFGTGSGVYSTDLNDPVRGEQMMLFKPAPIQQYQNGVVGTRQIEISELKPDASGSLTPQSIGRTESPTKDMDN